MAKSDLKRARAAGLPMSRATRLSSQAAKQRSGGLVGVLAVAALAIGGGVALYSSGVLFDDAGTDGTELTGSPSGAADPSQVDPSQVTVAPAPSETEVAARPAPAVSAQGAASTQRAARPAEAQTAGQPVDPSTSGTTSESLAMTPGLTSLRRPPSPAPLALPPGPALPGAPPAGPAQGGSPALAAAAPTLPQETAAQAERRCPVADDGTARLPVRFEQATNQPAAAALQQAVDFGLAALTCDGAKITVVGFANEARNPLAAGMESLGRARALLDMLEKAGVDTSGFEVFASPDERAADGVDAGAEIRVN